MGDSESQMVPCPYCHQPMVIMVRATESRLGARGRQWSAVGAAFSSGGGNGQSFEFSAPSLTGTLPSGGSRPISGMTPAISGLPGMLSPGEKRTSTEYRERSFGDVLIPLAYAGIAGVFTGVLAIPVAIWARWPWWLPPVIWIGSTAVWWFVASRWFLDDDKLIVKRDEQELTPPAAPVVVQPPSVSVEINERDERGKVTKQVRARLFAPASNPDGLWRYCQALAAEGAFPSWEGGQSGPGAKDFGYMESEFLDWRREAERAHLLKARPGRNQGYDITERGYAAFERIAEKQLEEASYGIS